MNKSQPRIIIGEESFEGLTEEGTVEAICALVISAIRDPTPHISLQQIFDAVSRSNRPPLLLDPLNLLPVILSSNDPAAQGIIDLMGSRSSPKEVIIAVQEAVERLESDLSTEAGDDAYEDATSLSFTGQLIRLVSLYSVSLPRLTLRKKTIIETIQPLFSDLHSVIQFASRRSSVVEGRRLLDAVSELVRDISSWEKVIGVQISDNVFGCGDCLKDLLDSTLVSFSHSIDSSLAQRSFKTCFPRLVVHSTLEHGWEGGESVILGIIETYSALKFTWESALDNPSLPSLILLAHSPLPPKETSAFLEPLIPFFLVSIQTNVALDESLALLLTSLHDAFSHSPAIKLSPDIIVPLSEVLPALASAHPDPHIRHMTFRIISLLLSVTPSLLRLRILLDLTSNSNFPQMRSAAISLVKEAVLEALSSADPSTMNLFASPLFLQTLGPTIFRPSPLDLFSSDLSVLDFQDSLEPSRITECLSLYYVVLQRDKQNQTGIRSPDNIGLTERNLLGPLRGCLRKWSGNAEVIDGHPEADITLASLQINVERVDIAIAGLYTI